MATIGVRELKQHASQVLRRVRERGEEIEVTHHGRVVARLVPVERQRSRQSPSAAWSPLAQGLVRRTGGPGRPAEALMIVDASVVVSHLVPHDTRHEACCSSHRSGC